MKGYQVVRAPDPAALVERVAAFVVADAAECIAARGRYRIALAGGSTPKALYERLAAPGAAERVRWPAVEVFFGDERCVPADHPDSNYRTAKIALLDRVPLDPARVHRMEGELAPDEAARRYEALLGRAPLDLVLLGIGEDGHTASLFPGHASLGEREKWVVAVDGSPKPPPQRITLTLPALAAARKVAFLISGAGKRDIAARALGELAGDAPTLPSAMVRPASGALTWYLDEPAASGLRS